MYKIAISGKAGSGKNTVASIILEELSILKNIKLTSQTIAFADPIKEIILKMFPGAREDYLFGPSELRSKEIPGTNFKFGKNISYRDALIMIGTMARDFNPNIWVECFDKSVKNLNPNKIIIVPDLRFQEEFNYLIDHNYFLIKLNREKFTKINDKSELDQDNFKNFNFILDNNGSLDDLRLNIKNNLIPLLLDI